MTPFLAEIHHARQARLQRFAEAAARYNDARQAEQQVRETERRAQATAQQIAALENATAAKPPLPTTAPAPAPQAKCRRDYESEGQPSAYVPTARRILRAVAAEFEMTIDEMLQNNQEPKFCIPRYVAIGLMLEMTRLSLPAIGRQLGGRDHATVLHGRKRLESLLASEAFRNRFDQIKAGIEG